MAASCLSALAFVTDERQLSSKRRCVVERTSRTEIRPEERSEKASGSATTNAAAATTAAEVAAVVSYLVIGRYNPITS